MKYTWLFGENLGNTMNNNSWYYFEHVVSNATADSPVDYYFIANRTSENKKIVARLDKKVRSRIVWRNSIKHHVLYWKSDMHFVTLSYKDILPDFYRDNNVNKQPVVYLQHGTVAIKKIGYTKNSYDNAIFKFMVYGTQEAQVLIDQNDFDEHQLKYSVAHPRYKQLVTMQDEYNKQGGGDRQILWFLTWREYLRNGSISEKDFFAKIKEVLQDDRLKNYLRKNNIKLKLALHQFFDGKLAQAIVGEDDDIYHVVNASSVNVMEDLVKSELLITDYSSIGFDFTFLKKPVLLYQFDSLVYSTNRDFYVEEKEIRDYKCHNRSDLVDAIVGGDYTLNEFFSSRLESDIDLESVKRGDHITEMNDYFIWAQQNKVSIFGYNFFGRGGTVTATKALAEGLARKGHIVELISLKRLKTFPVFPGGVIVRSFMNPWRSLKESLKYKLFIKQSLLSYLNSDVDRPRLIPYVGFALRRYLDKTKSRTVISTRETLHMFVDDTKNPNIVNKLFFFHTAADSVEGLFPGIMDQIAQRPIGKALFVTEGSRLRYIEELGYQGYDKYVVTGNSIIGTDIVKPEEIEAVGKKDEYRGIVLTRIASDRKEDINQIIEFGKYLKSVGNESIKIDVYGMGDYVFEFCDLITNNNLEDTIIYKGLTLTPHMEIREHDFLVDFSQAHTFGMIYIESILNGVMCFAKGNQGSNEVLGDIKGAIYKDWKDLEKKINNMGSIDTKTLVRNYKTIHKEYNTDLVAEKVSELLD